MPLFIILCYINNLYIRSYLYLYLCYTFILNQADYIFTSNWNNISKKLVWFHVIWISFGQLYIRAIFDFIWYPLATISLKMWHTFKLILHLNEIINRFHNCSLWERRNGTIVNHILLLWNLRSEIDERA